MNKPTKPTNLVPRSFGGVKNNFSSSLQTLGYEDGVPAVYGGDNLNYQLDATGKELDYCETICDFINNIPIAKTITVDANNNLVYKDWLGGRNFGELVYSVIPLSDSSLKLLDGSLLSYTGVYKSFIDYIGDIYSTYPSIFVTESAWQSNVSTYGVCGKFVYDSVNKTVRLPKITGLVEGTVDVNALGSIVTAGLPQHSHSGSTESSTHSHSGSTTIAGSHSHTRGDMNIKGTGCFWYSGYDSAAASQVSGAFFINSTAHFRGVDKASTGSNDPRLDFDASRSWTGSTSSSGSHSHTISIPWGGAHTHGLAIGNADNAIYGRSTTVQPQTIKCFVYMVVSTSLIKSDDVIDVDDIMSAVNSKADVDGTNMVSNLSSSALTYFTRLSLPTTTSTTITIPTSGNTITIPADGFICCSDDIKLTNDTRRLYGTYMSVVSGDTITVEYDSIDENSEIFFVYAQGGV